MNYISRNTSQYLLSGTALKMIAAAAMLIDHIGILIFTDVALFRIIGRIAFPIFAFMIAEGCRYTKNKLRYFLTVFIIAVICQTVYYLFDKSFEMCVFVTFSLSIIVIYAMQWFKRVLFSDYSIIGKCIAGGIFAVSVILVYIINQHFKIDYGFIGCILPVIVSVFDFHDTDAPQILHEADTLPNQILLMGAGLVSLAMQCGPVQYYSLFAIPLLMVYSGERGKYSMKYFFYIFYPVHLAVLQGIAVLTG